MKRFNFFKYTTLGNKVHTTYFDYWYFKKLFIKQQETNLLPKPSNGSYTSGGVKTIITDESITGSGLASASVFNIFDYVNFPTTMTSGKYQLIIPNAIDYNLRLSVKDEDGTNHNIDTSTIIAGTTSSTFTIPYNFTAYRLNLRNVTVGTQVEFTIINNIKLLKVE